MQVMRWDRRDIMCPIGFRPSGLRRRGSRHSPSWKSIFVCVFQMDVSERRSWMPRVRVCWRSLRTRGSSPGSPIVSCAAGCTRRRPPVDAEPTRGAASGIRWVPGGDGREITGYLFTRLVAAGPGRAGPDWVVDVDGRPVVCVSALLHVSADFFHKQDSSPRDVIEFADCRFGLYVVCRASARRQAYT